MSRITHCPKCSIAYKVSEEHVGKQAKCKCGHLFIVPNVPENPATPTSPQYSTEPTSRPAPLPLRPTAETEADASLMMIHWPWIVGASAAVLVIVGVVATVVASRKGNKPTLVADTSAISSPAAKPRITAGVGSSPSPRVPAEKPKNAVGTASGHNPKVQTRTDSGAKSKDSAPPDAAKATKDEFVVDEFDFEWIVAKSGEAKLVVEKTHDTTGLRISSSGMSGMLLLQPDDAELIGRAMADVDKYYNAMRGSKSDLSEELTAGKYEVTFRFSKSYGFSVGVREPDSIVSGVHLDRAAVKAFVPHLQKAKAMAAFVDKKIVF